MSDTLRIETDQRVPFVVRLVNKGDTYGRDNCLTYGGADTHFRAGDPLVEFYDARYPHTEYGQFVSRYYRSTLLAGHTGGLNLHGGEPAWQVDGRQMENVRSWLLSR